MKIPNIKQHYSTALFSLLILLLLGATQAQAQRQRDMRLEDLPRRAIDTIPTKDPETYVVTFSNNTWSYYRPTMDDMFGSLKVYNENWDSTQVFSYRSIELSDLSPVTEIKLISVLDDFHPPIKGKIFSKYGRRGRRNHNGVDIPLKIGEPIYATFDGRIRYSNYNNGGFGNLVIVRHKNGLETWNAHLSKLNVESGEYVKAGQIIGYGGNTGRSRGPHLHFEMRYYDQAFDPEHILDFENGTIKYQTFALEKVYFNIYSRVSDQLEEHDFDDFASLSLGEGDDVTSEDILKYLEKQESRSTTIAKTSQGGVSHTVKSGDMLGKIAGRYGVSIDQICRLNNISRTTVLKLGRTLKIK